MESSSFLRSPRFFFILILVVSFYLRWELVFTGGQLFNPDEYRYLYSRVVASEIQKGNWNEAMRVLTVVSAHQGFRFAGVIPAWVELQVGQNLHIPGLFFSLFSTINIALIWFLALRLGADEKEALWGTILAATSSALFYYSSHLFPYDLSMTFGLLALYIGLRRDAGAWDSIFTGILGFLSFFSYNGAWVIVAFAFVAHTLFLPKSYMQFFSRATSTALAFLASLIVTQGAGNLFGNDYLGGLVGFSETIGNGRYSEGAIFPFAYLWAAESWLFILWFALAGYSITFHSKHSSQRLIVWIGGILFIYASLAIPSVVLGKFVVYGRTARQLVPFLVLASAYGLRMIETNKRWGHTALSAVLIFSMVQAGLNFRRSFLIIYPADFAKMAQERYPDFLFPKNMTFFYTDNVIDVGPYKAYYIKYITPLPEEAPAIEGEILMSAEHPMSSFRPFRYEEGYSPEDKGSFPSDFSMMMLVRPNR